ncbi:MAG TPA: hypothetical protein VGE45_12810 [Chloroflexia bacterium]
MQYFERAVFELHPENQAPYDVLLSLAGLFQFIMKYPQGAPSPKASTDNATRRRSSVCRLYLMLSMRTASVASRDTGTGRSARRWLVE